MLEFLGWLFGLKPKDKKKKKKQQPFCLFEGCSKVCDCRVDCEDDRDSGSGLCIVNHATDDGSEDSDRAEERVEL